MCRYDGFELFYDIDSYVRPTCTQKKLNVTKILWLIKTKILKIFLNKHKSTACAINMTAVLAMQKEVF